VKAAVKPLTSPVSICSTISAPEVNLRVQSRFDDGCNWNEKKKKAMAVAAQSLERNASSSLMVTALLAAWLQQFRTIASC